MLSVPKRVMIDIQEIQTDEYKKQGIYYEPNEANMMEGTLFVRGPADTLYEDMPMVYSVKFPSSYPFDPPHVLFLTSDGYTRFHPNMYKEGKVCLSILGTWSGPKWSALLRLSSIALTLQSLLTNNPIICEPGYETRNDITTRSYNTFIGARCMRFLSKLLKNYIQYSKLPFCLEPFRELVSIQYPSILSRLKTRLQTKVAEGETAFFNLPYGLEGPTQYAESLDMLSKIECLSVAR